MAEHYQVKILVTTRTSEITKTFNTENLAQSYIDEILTSGFEDEEEDVKKRYPANQILKIELREIGG